MRFASTRNKSTIVGFAHAILNCMPEDGGLYVPCNTEDMRRWILYTDEKTSFTSIAGALTSAFIKDEFSPIICEAIATKAFPFSPQLRKLDDTHFMLELFHGPSGCHRDFGIAYLCACLETILHMQNNSAMILAVSHREFGAVLAHELRGKEHIKAVVVCPKGKVHGISECDYAWNGGNIYPVEVDGDENDCRAFVRMIFADREFVKENKLTVANTTNIGRLLPQTFFYPFAFSRLKSRVHGDIYYALAPGNYSNVIAGLYSWRFALPLSGFFLPATEALFANDVGDCVLLNESYQRMNADPAEPSNIERLEEVFSANGRMMRNFIYPVQLSSKQIDNAVKELFEKYHVCADRHTGRAYAAACKHAKMLAEDDGSVVIIARDHPALSSEYIHHVTGKQLNIPEHIAASVQRVAVKKPLVKSIDELRSIIVNFNNR